MEAYTKLYHDIANRTGGNIYIGVVGPVRTGKSTFIKRFMEEIVLPQMENGAKKDRAKDEMPQSGSGKSVMTTEPKFVPEESVKIGLDDGFGFRIKLIDCVGFSIPGVSGLSEDGNARMVNTPWSDKELPFEEAARLGTEKVIHDHSTIGIVITTDGSIGEIERDQYVAAESDVVAEMKKADKPFVILLNSRHPEHEETKNLAKQLNDHYQAPVIPINCLTMTETDFTTVLKSIVLEFPVREIKVLLPSWLLSLKETNAFKIEIEQQLIQCMKSVHKMGECEDALNLVKNHDLIKNVFIQDSNPGNGSITVCLNLKNDVFWEVLSDSCGYEIRSEETLLKEFSGLYVLKNKYEKISKALDDVEAMGYGIVTPELDDLSLEEPEIVKQAGGYGVKLKASAPSIHMIRADIQAEISPIVGTERQSEDIVKFLLKEFEEDPKKIWQSNMFGKSLYELVNEGLNNKLNQMPSDARRKLAGTLEKIINEGSGGLICIIL